MPARSSRRKFGPSQKDRIFLAAVPDVDMAARIHALAEALKDGHGFTGSLILPEHLHVTLFHLGDWAALPDEIVALASSAASQVNVPPFEVAFHRVQSFRNSTGVFPFVLTGDKAQWRMLHEALRVALTEAGLGGATRGDFEPHVTLTYDKVRVKPRAISPIGWTVKDFVLIHSELGKTAHNHLGRWHLGRWPLA
ncbi:MAG: 2'-5' RNA ligase family protein [Proteobacteria bacterium]|nr:2'-5' RNA ligase family protein [Pseudomonadota bacterium]